MRNHPKRFSIQRAKKFEVHYELIPNPTLRNQATNRADRFKIRHISQAPTNDKGYKPAHYHHHSEKAIVKNVVISICLVPPEVFQKISEVIQKYLLD